MRDQETCTKHAIGIQIIKQNTTEEALPAMQAVAPELLAQAVVDAKDGS